MIISLPNPALVPVVFSGSEASFFSPTKEGGYLGQKPENYGLDSIAKTYDSSSTLQIGKDLDSEAENTFSETRRKKKRIYNFPFRADVMHKAILRMVRRFLMRLLEKVQGHRSGLMRKIQSLV